MKKLKLQLLIAVGLLSITSASIANEKVVASELFSGDTLAFVYKDNFSNATVNISGPNNYYVTKYQKQGAPTIDLSQVGSLKDGKYMYEISVATNKTVEVSDTLNNGRGKNAKTTKHIGEIQTGIFRVKDGAIVQYLDIKEGE